MSNGNNVTLDNNNAKKRAIPIGISDFKEIIEGNYCYVDKSLCVKELLDNKAKVTLLPRPRRFGKTLTLSMLRYFFEKNSGSHAPLFEKLAIAQHPEIMKHQGQYPVIFFTLKEAKQPDWESCYAELKRIIRQEYERHRYLLDSEKLLPLERDLFKRIMMQEDDSKLYRPALKNLSSYLEQYHGVKPVVLIDEYDAPIHSGYGNGYYDKIIDFIRSFLGAGLKDNNALNFAVMTGILRVAKESIFSGLNNLAVYTMLNDPFSTTFGFTQIEVDQLLQEYNLTNQAEEVRRWYNGYLMGSEQSVYNPWSILNFLNLRKIGPYWVNTSDNLLIKKLVIDYAFHEQEDLELLLSSKDVRKRIYETVTMLGVDDSADDELLWTFLLFSGYLSFRSISFGVEGHHAELCLPNLEVLTFYNETMRGWIKQRFIVKDYLNMLKSLVSGDLAQFKKFFYDITLHSLSAFDTGGNEPEKFYHALVLGMLVSLSESHEVISNRESGYGRYDIMIIPKCTGGQFAGIANASLSTSSVGALGPQKPGIIIEFKKIDRFENEDLEKAAASALKQIEERQYQAQLEARGIKSIIKLAIVFEGKNCLVREAGEATAA